MQLSLPQPSSRRQDLWWAWLLPATAAAIWPLWAYLWRSYTAPGADPAAWMVLLGAAGTALWIAFTTPADERAEARPGEVGFTALALALFALVYQWAPPLARAVLGLFALGLALRTLPGVAERGGWGLAALVVLSAPATDTLNFFVGGALRAASAQLASVFLMGGGHTVRVEEAALWIDGRLFSVDAPCSGVNGLWTGMVVAAAIATWRRMGLAGMLCLLASSVALCVPANGWRAASLVYLTALSPEGVFQSPLTGESAHAAVGLIVFGGTVLALVGIGCWVSNIGSGIVARHSFTPKNSRPIDPADPATRSSLYPCPLAFAYVAVLLVAALVPLMPTTGSAASAEARAFPGWPAEWGFESLRRLPETEMDRRWARLSPGPLARFALEDGSELLLRWVDRPTRALHAPEDCYRGAGARVTSLPPVRQPMPGSNYPVLWRRSRVSQEGREWEVRSIIRSASGATYSDPAWWWWRVAGPGATDSGPWWAIIVQTPL